MEDSSFYSTFYLRVESNTIVYVGAHDYLEENVLNMYLWMRNLINADWDKVEFPVESGKNWVCVYPNPLQQCTTIRFHLEEGGNASVVIINQDGKLKEYSNKYTSQV
jgi:hypothetical protein